MKSNSLQNKKKEIFCVKSSPASTLKRNGTSKKEK